jgi:hypothetical protein
MGLNTISQEVFTLQEKIRRIFTYIYLHVQKLWCLLYAPAKGADTLPPISTLPLFLLCGPDIDSYVHTL